MEKIENSGVPLYFVADWLKSLKLAWGLEQEILEKAWMHIFHEFPNLVNQCYYVDESETKSRKLLAKEETLIELTELLINLVEIPG